MSAKTRQNVILQQRDKIAGLYANAHTLLAQGKRDDLQAEHLKHALQLFKENRLAGAIAKASSDVPVNIHQALSVLITDVLPARVARHVYNSYGEVLYVGEMLRRTRRDLRWDTNRSKAQWALVCKEALADLGLPLDLDLNESGWIPPYATDEKVLSIWAKRIHEIDSVCRRYTTGIGGRGSGGCMSIGEVLQKSRHRYMTDKLALHFVEIRSSMYVPPSWQAPPLNVEECLAYSGSKENSMVI